MRRELRWYDLITVNIFYLGLAALSQTNGLAFPLLVQGFVGEQVQGTYLGTLRLWTLMVALLVQALMGMLSDRSQLPWGRRRPFILLGTLGASVTIMIIALSNRMSGLQGYVFLFFMAIVQMIAINAAQAAEQGLIPDLIPENQRGRFSGVKAMFEVPIPLILVSFTVAPLLSRGNWWVAFGLMTAMLIICMLLTLLVPESPPQATPLPFRWEPVWRLGLMAATFTVLILGMGQVIRWVGNLASSFTSLYSQITLVGFTGLLAMLAAVGLGVWTSVRVSVGEHTARQNKSFTWWVINRLAFLVGVINLSTFAVYFVQTRLGYAREKAAGPAAILMMIVGVCILLSALPSGVLADRWSRKSMVAFSGLIAGLGVLVVLLSTSLPVIYVGGAMIGIATGLFYTVNWALGTSLVPPGEAGRFLGISNLAGAGAGAVGAYIGGPIADYFTVRVTQLPGLGYIVLFSIYGFLFILSIAALRQIREPAQGAFAREAALQPAGK